MAEHDYLQVQDGERGSLLFRTEVGIFPPPERIWWVIPLSTLEGTDSAGLPSYAWLGEWESLNASKFNPDVECCVTELVRRSYSKISDEDIADMTHVARGALYTPASDDDNS